MRRGAPARRGAAEPEAAARADGAGNPCVVRAGEPARGRDEKTGPAGRARRRVPGLRAGRV